MVFETQRRKNLLDALINHVLAPRSLSDFRLGLQAFLRLYTFEMNFAGGDCEKAATIANMGRSVLGWRELGEVEEVLGEILNVRVDEVVKNVGDEERVALTTYHQLWFVKYCTRLFGRGEALRFLNSGTETQPTYVRVNTLRVSEEDCLEKMRNEGIVAEEEPALKHTYKVVKSGKPLVRTQSFRSGLFYIQDKASCVAAEVADPKAGATVLDVCAAPGAKTTYMGQLMKNQGAIYSVDYSTRRMSVWKREVQRMGVEIALPIIADARKPLPTRFEADLVVLDPPCTSTGAFSRVPSAKWRLTKRSVERMAEVQWDMLLTCAGCVKDGGFLVYSTCSVTLEENEVLVERFLKWRPEFRLVEASPRVGLSGFRGLVECQRLYPHVHGCNGFFVAKLLKSGS